MQESCKVSVGGNNGPNKSVFHTISGTVSMSYGDVLDGITIDTTHVGGYGGNSKSLTLGANEYFSSFKINSDPGYMGGIVTSVELTTNLNNIIVINNIKLPTTSNPPISVIVEKCKIHAIEFNSGDFINKITVSYISNYTEA